MVKLLTSEGPLEWFWLEWNDPLELEKLDPLDLVVDPCVDSSWLIFCIEDITVMIVRDEKTLCGVPEYRDEPCPSDLVEELFGDSFIIAETLFFCWLSSDFDRLHCDHFGGLE